MSLRQFTFLVVVLSCTLYGLLFASRNAHAGCTQSTGVGEVFYNFDKLYVFYSSFPRNEVSDLATYPDALQFDKFNAKLTDSLKQTFKECLIGSQGEAKEIITIPPAFMGTYTEDDLGVLQNPKHLVVLLNVQYMPHQQVSPEVNQDYAQLMFSIYRSNIKDGLARMPLTNISAMMVAFPSLGESDLDRRLSYFFNRIRPITVGSSANDIHSFKPQ